MAENNYKSKKGKVLKKQPKNDDRLFNGGTVIYLYFDCLRCTQKPIMNITFLMKLIFNLFFVSNFFDYLL